MALYQDEREFIAQSIKIGVQPLYAKVEQIAEKQDANKEDTNDKFHQLFALHNDRVAPVLGDVKWLKIILSGCWSVLLIVVGVVAKLWMDK